MLLVRFFDNETDYRSPSKILKFATAQVGAVSIE